MSIRELESLEDALLIKEIQKKTPCAMTVFFERKNESMLMPFLLAVLHQNEFEAEEADQKTWIKAAQYLEGHPDVVINTPDTWLRTIAFHCAFTKPKKRIKIAEVPDEYLYEVQDRTDDDKEWKKNHDRMLEMLMMTIPLLPEGRRKIVEMKLKGMTFVEIEEELGLRKHSASSEYSKAVQQLVVLIGKFFGDTE